ncbi:hypothetical protein HNR23_004268 [Nocardiopsis mwathae]|uniref:Uncharacterized protein n=1 Tax=Nocardiopsis mwathae TaxID=1472723 RepID=A0A7W9YL73_9ACTN|nr:hypothetical protein [Nocardiopsis mwathae]MBB6174208.1 hypothetical protein [Nocardiopsis mwathae]
MTQLMAAGGTSREKQVAAMVARLKWRAIAKATPFKDPIEREIDPFPRPAEREMDREDPREGREDPLRREGQPEKVGV